MNSYVTIVIILLQYIIDNIYQLLSHGPASGPTSTHMRSYRGLVPDRVVMVVPEKELLPGMDLVRRMI